MAVIDITIPSFFKEVYQGLKDSVNYVATAGSQPYLIGRTLRIDQKKFSRTPYWYWYKEIIDGKNPTAYFTKMVSVFPDVGVGLVKGKKYIDFIYQGRKVVIPFVATYMKLEEERTAFQLTYEKQQAIRDLKKAVEQTQYAINQITVGASKLSPSRFEYYKQQQMNLVEQLFKVPGVQVQAAKDKLVLSGLGAEPVTVVAVSVVIIVSVLVFGWVIKKITDAIGFTLQIKSQTDIINKNVEREIQADKMLAEQQITPQQHEQIRQEAQANIQESSERTEQIIKTQKTAVGKDDLFGTIKTIGFAALGIVFIDALIKWNAGRQTTIINKPT